MKHMNDALKIGLILNSRIVPLWVYEVMKSITDSESASIKLVVYNREAGSNQTGDPFVRKVHEKLDRLIFRHGHDYDSAVNSSGLLRNILKIPVHSGLLNTYHRLAAFNLDVIINFSSAFIPVPGLVLAKFGVWDYVIGNQSGEKLRGYWEIVRKEPAMAVAFRCRNSSFKREMTIYRGWFPVNYNSIHINLDHACRSSSFIISRLLNGIYQFGPGFFKQQVLKYEQKIEQRENTLPSSPTNYVAFKNMLLIMSRYLYLNIVYKNKWKWYLMFKNDPDPLLSLSENYRSLIPPSDRFWADPFIISRDKEFLVFVEEFIYKRNIGHIALLKLNKEGQLIHSEKILERPYHMSYPFIFSHNDNYYMIPETSGNKTIELYECIEFPGKWSFVMNLMENIIARDTTPFFYRNKWWLFTSICENPDFPDHDELFLFYSGNLFTTQWTPHPLNPVITDVRISRSAGRIFIRDHKIYRPSQDCSGRYGKAFNLNQITALSETKYSEILISKTEANWNPKLRGTHTFNFDKNYTVIDVYRFCPRFNFLSVQQVLAGN